MNKSNHSQIEMNINDQGWGKKYNYLYVMLALQVNGVFIPYFVQQGLLIKGYSQPAPDRYFFNTP